MEPPDSRNKTKPKQTRKKICKLIVNFYVANISKLIVNNFNYILWRNFNYCLYRIAGQQKVPPRILCT